MFATGIAPGCDRSDPAPPDATQLQQLHDQLQRAVEALDPASLSVAVALSLTEGFAAIERLAAAGKVLCAGRAAEATPVQLGGHRNAGQWLAAISGTTKTEAAELLGAAERLADLPATESALRAGALSGAQLRAVTDGAAADAGSEAMLLSTAATESVWALRQAAEAAKNIARSAAEDAARHARAGAHRRLR